MGSTPVVSRPRGQWQHQCRAGVSGSDFEGKDSPEDLDANHESQRLRSLIYHPADNIRGMSLLEQDEPAGSPTLQYATPERLAKRPAAIAAVMLMSLFVCGTSLTIFALVVHEHMDLWPAAAAVIALVGMAVACAFLMTRRD